MNYKQELKRKGIHQLSLAIPISYLLFSKTFVLNILIPVTLLVIAVDVARFKFPWFQKQFVRFFGVVLREHETRRFPGSTYLLTGAVLTIWLFPKHYAVLSLFFVIIADTAAALVGKQIGKHKIFNKSVEGTAAFFISALAIALFFPTIAVPHAVVGAATAAIIEVLPLPVDDNLTIPVGTCFVLWLVFL